MDAVSARLGAVGFRTEVPDLFGSLPAWLAAPGAALALPTRRGRAFDRADEAFADTRPVGVVAFSLGAAMALRRDWPVPTVVAYGHVPRRISARPILGIYGTADRLLRSSGRRLEHVPGAQVRWYDGAGHSFLASDGVPSLGSMVGPHPVAAHAWADIVEFLTRTIPIEHGFDPTGAE